MVFVKNKYVFRILKSTYIASLVAYIDMHSYIHYKYFSFLSHGKNSFCRLFMNFGCVDIYDHDMSRHLGHKNTEFVSSNLFCCLLTNHTFLLLIIFIDGLHDFQNFMNSIIVKCQIEMKFLAVIKGNMNYTL